MGESVILYVQVRRFKCLNPQCPQTTFVEPIEDLAPTKRSDRIRIISARRAERHEQDDYYRENSP
jgi:hypothetical protein